MDESLYSLKTSSDELEVEYDVLPVVDLSEKADNHLQLIEQNINDIDDLYHQCEDKIAQLNTTIDRLTDNSDLFDYSLAVVSGIIAGVVDSIFVGKWNFEAAKAKSNKEVNEMVMNFAKKHGFNGERLDCAIKYLEKIFRLPGDNDFHSVDGITLNTHHLDDFCHHPTLVGLFCCIIVQFTGQSIYCNKYGEMSNIPISVNKYGNFIGDNFKSKIFSGVVNWFFNVVSSSKNAYGHWMSDIAGSSSSTKGGAGLPGPLMSLLKELSSLKIFRELSPNFAETLRKAYQNGIGTRNKQVDLGVFNKLFEGASSKFDFRTEKAVIGELKRQTLPIIINEAIVRGFYFIRRFINEVKRVDSIMDVNWTNIIPVANRTIARMMTIASGTFMTLDLADSSIRSLIKSKGINPDFAGNFILRINFVGIGRFAVAMVTDSVMGIPKACAESEKDRLERMQIFLLGAKVYYKESATWVAAENAARTINDLTLIANNALLKYAFQMNAIGQSTKNIVDNVPCAVKKNSGLDQDILSILDEV